MRVMFLLHAHPDLQAGGTEIFARDLFRNLRNRGVSGLLLAGTAAHQRSGSPGTPFQAIGNAADEVLAWTGGFDPFFLSQIDLHGLSYPLAELLREQRPDVVHIHHVLTLGVEIIGLIRRCLPETRIVMTLHDYYALCAHDGQMVKRSGVLCHMAQPDACRACFPERSLTDFKLRDLHIGQALDLVDHFIAPSSFLRDRFIAAGIASERISIIPNGFPAVDPTRPEGIFVVTGSPSLAISTASRAPPLRSKRPPSCRGRASLMIYLFTAELIIKLKIHLLALRTRALRRRTRDTTDPTSAAKSLV